ncbi:nitroreductase/quinone reductase family protein [Microbacterium sp. X-17]|uniref:nitroreductase/quinone reductase family protein n=1 Tax=Microbacterium sp. X-17 TaxID=3144404 RepID=UPI0031F55A7E
MSDERYVKPTTWDTAFNAVVGWSTRMGMPMAGSRVLAVRGRASGEWRTTPVNPLVVAGERYLVAPRGETQWVRNLRAAGGRGELRKGRSAEAFSAVEILDAEKPPILREYLRVWAWEVGRFFEGVDKASSEAKLLEIAPGFPVFRLAPAE